MTTYCIWKAPHFIVCRTVVDKICIQQTDSRSLVISIEEQVTESKIYDLYQSVDLHGPKTRTKLEKNYVGVNPFKTKLIKPAYT